MTSLCHIDAGKNDQNWLYPNSSAWPLPNPMHVPQTPDEFRDPLPVLDPIALRADWVPACEAAIQIADPAAFMCWMEDYVRPLLGYRLLACGTGVLLARGVSVERLLVRGIRLIDAERLRDTAGTVVLPRGLDVSRRDFSDVDIDGLTLRAWGAMRPERMKGATSVAMERALGTQQSGSYFLFGSLDRPVDARSRYDLSLIAPHMHDALTRALTGVTDRRRAKGKSENLTRTERELLGFLVAGRTTAEIAGETFRSVHTVANHVRAIMRKLSAKNRTEAISKALGQGLVEPVAAAPRTRIIAAQPIAAYRVAPVARVWRGSYRRLLSRGRLRMLLAHPGCA
jgi:DNA-binding CsgD family transcriptional regulator